MENVDGGTNEIFSFLFDEKREINQFISLFVLKKKKSNLLILPFLLISYRLTTRKHFFTSHESILKLDSMTQDSGGNQAYP